MPLKKNRKASPLDNEVIELLKEYKFDTFPTQVEDIQFGHIMYVYMAIGKFSIVTTHEEISSLNSTLINTDYEIKLEIKKVSRIHDKYRHRRYPSMKDLFLKKCSEKCNFKDSTPNIRVPNHPPPSFPSSLTSPPPMASTPPKASPPPMASPSPMASPPLMGSTPPMASPPSIASPPSNASTPSMASPPPMASPPSIASPPSNASPPSMFTEQSTSSMSNSYSPKKAFQQHIRYLELKFRKDRTSLNLVISNQRKIIADQNAYIINLQKMVYNSNCTDNESTKVAFERLKCVHQKFKKVLF
eukprot:TRINITY_DN4176_c0_g1_i2.p1 TRINITY_DN4176_c0_g1~~TRINITY_DN4176_c0_g1_i2.p1  ORF type:complete len:301 (+),score=39.84 TRINITY_DN4176_c0_g1_i2:72-974(+)